MVFGLEQYLSLLVQSPLLVLQGIDLFTIDVLFARAFLEALLGNLEIFFIIV
jgi:hypothetical protein